VIRAGRGFGDGIDEDETAMPLLELLHTKTFDAEMNRLRCECFAGTYPSGDAKDDFDDRSIHVVTRVDGRLAGYGRLTPGPDSWFEFLSNGRAVIPTGADVVDFGRVMVAPAHRGHDQFELVLVEGLLWACDRGFNVVVGSSRPERRFRPFIHELGFADAGAPVQFEIGEGWTELGQLVTVCTDQNRQGWAARKRRVLGRFRGQGFDIVDRGCSVAPAAGEGQT
jgi:predicted GNAT family N-acyltransferase